MHFLLKKCKYKSSSSRTQRFITFHKTNEYRNLLFDSLIYILNGILEQEYYSILSNKFYYSESKLKINTALAAFLVPLRYLTVTSSLPQRSLNVPSTLPHRYLIVTSSLPHRYLTVTPPLQKLTCVFGFLIF